MKTVKDAEIFCQYIAHEYLGKRNYKLLEDIIDKRITIIGTELTRLVATFKNL